MNSSSKAEVCFAVSGLSCCVWFVLLCLVCIFISHITVHGVLNVVNEQCHIFCAAFQLDLSTVNRETIGCCLVPH